MTRRSDHLWTCPDCINDDRAPKGYGGARYCPDIKSTNGICAEIKKKKGKERETKRYKTQSGIDLSPKDFVEKGMKTSILFLNETNQEQNVVVVTDLPPNTAVYQLQTFAKHCP